MEATFRQKCQKEYTAKCNTLTVLNIFLLNTMDMSSRVENPFLFKFVDILKIFLAIFSLSFR